MPLWRVDINQVAHRYVEAETGEAAKTAVAHAVVSSFDLTATPANATLTVAYFDSGPIKRRRLLASLDGLTHPMRRDVERRAARRKLARLVLSDMSLSAWVSDATEDAPLLPRPEGVDNLLRSSEMRQIERNFHRLRDDELNSPFHS